MTDAITSPPDEELSALAKSGLTAYPDGNDGWVFETTVDHSEAVARHEDLLATFDVARSELSPGSSLLLGLVCDDVVLTQSDLSAATSQKGHCYRGATVYLEWPRAGGWRDRRALCHTSQVAINRNSGYKVTAKDWQDAALWLQTRDPEKALKDVWPAFLADAKAWWFQHLSGPAFAHVVGLRQLQLLPREALARRATKRPQLPGSPNEVIAELDLARFQLQTIRTNSHDYRTLSEFGHALREIVRRKGSKASAREAVVSVIDGLMPRAMKEGRAQALVLMGTRHVVRNGGMRGKLLAPRSLEEYLRDPLPLLAAALTKLDVHSRSAQEWHVLYRSIIETVPKLQQKKLEAFLEVFHRFLVICGAQPLQRSISGGARPVPPIATVVWPHELALAVRYIWASDCTEYVKQQAELGLRLAYRVPMRIEDLWCIRMVDVCVENRCWFAISPRQRDGYGKSPALRRQEDLDGDALLSILNQLYRRRKAEVAGDEDVLLGAGGVPDVRHEEELTTTLMNQALRWATGSQTASFHDLRHTRISYLSAKVFAGVMADSDVGVMQNVSAASGQAGPGSSIAYQHWIEGAIAEQAAVGRPSAWKIDACCDYFFEAVGEGLVAVEPLVPGPHHINSPRSAQDLSLSERSCLLQHIIDESSLDAAAARSHVGVDVAKTVLAEMSAAFQWAKLADYSQVASTRLQCSLLRSLWLWARAAMQRKHDPVVSFIESQISSGRWSEVRAIWSAWLLCADGEDLDLTNTPAAVQMVSLLMRAKVPLSALLVVSHDSAPALAPMLSRCKLDQRVVVDRDGRRHHRLQMSDPACRAIEMTGAALSMLGVHWWMLCMGSMVISQGDT